MEDRTESSDSKKFSVNRVRWFLFVLCISCLLQGTCFALTARLIEEAEVTGAQITFGDVAEFDEQSTFSRALASRYIAQSPKAGESVRISQDIIKRKISGVLQKNTELHWEGSQSVLVRRAGVVINPQDMESAIADYIRDRSNDLPEAEYRFIPRELPLPFTIPIGELELDIIPGRHEVIGSRRMTLIYKVDGKVVQNISIRGKLEAMASVAILTQNVKRGSILSPLMVRLETRDLGELRSPCTNLRDVLGKRLTRSLRPGSVLDLSFIEFPPLIKKGQLVKILINHNGLHLSAKGVSAMNGKQDQIIRVMNTSSRKTVYCKVTAPGIVEVQI